MSYNKVLFINMVSIVYSHHTQNSDKDNRPFVFMEKSNSHNIGLVYENQPSYCPVTARQYNPIS